MIRASQSVCIEAKSDVVWAQLAKLEDIVLWSSDVLRASCTGRGVGADRFCALAGNINIREHIVDWEEGKSLKYEGFGLPMVKRACNRWSVRSEGEKTLLTTEAEIEIRGGVFGRLLEPFMKLMIHRMAPRTLASFKYLVETGQPFKGKSSELPPISSVC